MLFAHGSPFGGHALYVKDNRLHYVYNFVGMVEQKIVATEDIPTGEKLILSASFDKSGEDPPGVATGLLSLWHGDTKVGEGQIKTQPGKFMIAGEGLCIGRDGGAGVTDDYPGREPWRFTGGTIRRVAVDVSGEAYIDLEREAARDADARVARPSGLGCAYFGCTGFSRSPCPAASPPTSPPSPRNTHANTTAIAPPASGPTTYTQ